MEQAAAAATTAASRRPCALRLLLFAELVSDAQLAAVMPTNALRNAARLAATTRLAAMLDADLAVSSRFSSLAEDSDWCVSGHGMGGVLQCCVRGLSLWPGMAGGVTDGRGAFLAPAVR